MANNSKTKVVTGTVRLSYANVWEPKSINGGAEKYSVSLIIPKSDKKTIAAINAAVDAAMKKDWRSSAARNRTRLPSSFLCAMAIRNATMRLMRTAISSTPTVRHLLKSWIRT